MRLASWATCLVLLLSCRSAPDADARERLLASAPARRLVGTWDLTLSIDSGALFWKGRPMPAPVAGTLVLAPDHSGPTSSPALDGITHVGAYDIDLAPLGVVNPVGGAAAFAVARLAPRRSWMPDLDRPDSLWIVLGSAPDRFPIRLRGRFDGDSASGVWVAEAFSAGGSTGHFAMHRHVEPR